MNSFLNGLKGALERGTLSFLVAFISLSFLLIWQQSLDVFWESIWRGSEGEAKGKRRATCRALNFSGLKVGSFSWLDGR